LLNKCDKMMLEENFAYGMVSRSQQHNQIAMQFLYSAYKAGDTVLAAKVSRGLRKDMQQQAAYYESLSDSRRDILSYEEERNQNLLKGLLQMEQQFKNFAPTEAPQQISTPPVVPGVKDSQKK
jgi:hypothetical protein